MKLSLSFILLFITVLVEAQENFVNGYVITLTGDTIRGKLRNFDKYDVYKKVEFTDNQNMTKNWGPNDALGYGQEGKQYISMQRDTFYLVLGSVDFSILKAYNGYYLKTKDNGLDFLENKSKSIYSNNLKKMVEISGAEWRQKLNVLTSSCPNLKRSILNMEYNDASFLKLLENYADCKGQSVYLNNQNLPKFRSRFGVVLGGQFSNLKTNFTWYKLHYLIGRYTEIVPTAGIAMEFSTPRLSQRMTFSPEIRYSKVSYNGTVIEENSLSDIINKNTFSHHEIIIPLKVRYKLNNSSLRKYFNFGLLTKIYLGSQIITNAQYEGTPIVIEKENYHAPSEEFSTTSRLKFVSGLGPLIGYNLEKDFNKKQIGVGLYYSFFLPQTSVLADLNSHELVLSSYMMF